ncbi:hypothetical protein POX_c04709 [Penicillium oxalicum]|uniref:Uncharacterized protein n=1 Tax=Penicillium oxalicum (strain 114-2 / CGMCC 5302) TaxID=933388 RepID=S7Z7T9_PENO1|nr:hypothetical protein POX_c04709 [Penicillium oxalicum]EPS26244.1 hypothetical protein PDE_01180 [Penicillium oxalicum 114-2]KAI2791830.1 hypothetical protein POX_c04709 [Penicillium oxalicum]
MDACTETYTRRQSDAPPARQVRMKIDSLLNPSGDDGREERSSRAGSPFSSQHAVMSSSSHSGGYLHSPGYPPSPNQYWYGRYHDYHDTSPGGVSSATGHASGGSSISSSSSSSHHHPHPHHHSPRSGNSQQHHHHMFLSYRPTNESTHSSPDPYHPRERYDSVSSSSSNNGDRRRPPRPKYEEEEMYFIWYHRVDLCQEWKEVRESFNRQFPSRQRRGFQGIQCKFYRFIKEKKCPTLREQRRMRDGEFLRDGASMGVESGAPKFGVREWANVWYPWMREGTEMKSSQSRIST